MQGPADQTQRLRRDPDSEQAWREWFRTVYRRVYYTVYRATDGDRQRAEDLTQAAIERFLRYRALHKVATDEDAVAYLVRTALRVDMDQARQRGLAHAPHESSGALPEEEFDQQHDPLDLLDLDLLVARLAPADRQLIAWRREGQSIGDIARFLGITYTAAAVRIHRAKARLSAIARRA